MAKLFITGKELQFFNSINKELIQRIIGQEITYYHVSIEKTVVNELYNEAIEKVVYQPVLLNALILYNAPEQTSTNFTVDTVYSIEVYMHIHELEERNIKPREGDFVKFGEVMYEVATLTQPQITFGQIENMVMWKATCTIARESNFKIET